MSEHISEQIREEYRRAHRNDLQPANEAERRECLAETVNPALIESAFLYYWARVSTINAAVPKSFFQKLERHWPEVPEGVERFVKGL